MSSDFYLKITFFHGNSKKKIMGCEQVKIMTVFQCRGYLVLMIWKEAVVVLSDGTTLASARRRWRKP
jgi:hypothetical protein